MSDFSVTAATTGKLDPFNYQMPCRKDLMSLSSINYCQDGMKTTTMKFSTVRALSNNMTTRDIDGKLHNLLF